MVDDEQNNLEQENTPTEPESKKDNIFKKSLNKIGTGISKIAQGAYTGAKNFIDEIQAHQGWNKHFELSASEFSVYPLNFENDKEYYKKIKYISAIKIAEKQCLLVRGADKISVNQVLMGKQNQVFKIVDFEDNPEPYPSSEVQYPIDCFKYFYKPYERQISQTIQNITNNQTVTVGDNNSGDITLVADFSSQLADIEKAIHNYQPSIFNKKKKDEAIKLYGNFKNCVMNKQKDQSLFDKFIKVLEVVAPVAISIVSTIIATI